MSDGECPHLSLVLAITKEDLLQKSENGVCTECREKGPKVWACLQGNCNFIGCGEAKHDHSSKHYKLTKHSVTVNLFTFRVWCYSCNKEVRLPSLFTPFEMKTLKKNMKNKTLEAEKPSTDNLPSLLQEETNIPIGLTGLRNLGNTCYMNASLQSLSNCLPLTNFFLNFDTPSEKNATMAKNYMKLISEIWDTKRPPTITPSGVHMTLKMINPAFRGYQQQDAQEFLRCIMDRLHEELKYPVTKVEEYDLIHHEQGSQPVIAPRSYSPMPSARHERSPSLSSSDSFCSTSSEPNRRQGKVEHFSTNDLSKLHGSASPQKKKDLPADNIPSNNKDKKNHNKVQHELKSIISDIFDGKLRSSVQCLTCDQVSHTRETFQDLSLPIPGKDDLSRLHGNVNYLPASGSSRMPIVPGFKGPCAQTYSTTDMFYAMFEWLKSWIWGPYITLNDCLAAFFSADELKGDNMYSCEKCKKLRNGVKYCKLLELPEVVCIHLKRFRHEYLTSYSTKISSPVYFPLKGLDLRPYLAQDSPSHCTKYDLCSVIVHLGNAGGGHYLAYSKNISNKKWYEFDDQYVSEVPETTVANTEAYVLFYCKTSAESSRARDRIWSLFHQEREAELAPHPSGRSSPAPLMQFLVSLQWIQRFLTFAEPGPIDNRDFVCHHGGVLPDKINSLETLTIPVSEHIWGELHEKYGGGPVIRSQHAQQCEICRKDSIELEERRTREKDMFIKLDGAETAQADYYISMKWFKQWERFLHSKQYDPPGEIDNSSIAIVKDSVVHLKPRSEYGSISEEAWNYLHSIYGGGPVLCDRRRRVPVPVAMETKQETMETESLGEETSDKETSDKDVSMEIDNVQVEIVTETNKTNISTAANKEKCDDKIKNDAIELNNSSEKNFKEEIVQENS